MNVIICRCVGWVWGEGRVDRISCGLWYADDTCPAAVKHKVRAQERNVQRDRVQNMWCFDPLQAEAGEQGSHRVFN